MVLKYRQFLKSSNLRRGLFRFVGDFVAAGMDEFEFKSPCKSMLSPSLPLIHRYQSILVQKF